MPRANLGGSYMVPETPHFDRESLERASGLTFPEHQRAVFVAAMHRYLRYLKLQRGAVQIKDVRHHCQEMLKHASALVDLLELRTKNTPRVGDRTPSDDDYISFHQQVFSQFPDDFDSRSYLHVMIQLRISVVKALRKVSQQGKPGRQDKEGLDVTIRRCHEIYREAGGSGYGCTRSGSSRTAKGPFLDLMHKALKQLAAQDTDGLVDSDVPDTKNALAQRILIALKHSVQPQARDEK